MVISDNEGLSGMSLFNNAAQHYGLTQGHHQKPEEQTKVANGAPLVTDPFSDPSHWGILTNQAPQQAAPPVQQQTPPQQQVHPQQQIVPAHATPGNPLALPKDQATLNQMIQQGVMGTIGQLAQINQQKNADLDGMRRKMLDDANWRKWYPTYEHSFNKLVNQGHDLNQAKALALQTCKEMADLGHTPSERAMNAAIPSQYSGNHANIKGGQFRSDENPDAVAHFTDEEKIEKREDWVNRRNVYADYIKSNGQNGMSYQEMYPAAFNRGNKELIIVKK